MATSSSEVTPGGASAPPDPGALSPPAAQVPAGAIQLVAPGAAAPALGLRALTIGQMLKLERAISGVAPKSPFLTATLAAALAHWDVTANELDAASATQIELERSLQAQRQLVASKRMAFILAGTEFAAAARSAVHGNAFALGQMGVPYHVTTRRAPVLVPDAPTRVTVVWGKATGSVVVECPKEKGAKRYAVEQCMDGASPAVWQIAQREGARRLTLRGLPPGQSMSFRMAAINAAGTSPFSAPVSIVIR